MTIRKKIILAVANGCASTRQVAKFLSMSYSTVNNYFYKTNNFFGQRFVNGKWLQWSPGKANTLQLSPRMAIIRGAGGQIKDVGLIADMDDLEVSFDKT